VFAGYAIMCTSTQRPVLDVGVKGAARTAACAICRLIGLGAEHNFVRGVTLRRQAGAHIWLVLPKRRGGACCCGGCCCSVLPTSSSALPATAGSHWADGRAARPTATTCQCDACFGCALSGHITITLSCSAHYEPTQGPNPKRSTLRPPSRLTKPYLPVDAFTCCRTQSPRHGRCGRGCAAATAPRTQPRRRPSASADFYTSQRSRLPSTITVRHLRVQDRFTHA
jgi:hypothetical protein